jgi:prolipoprotein diacylglyceryltransferase
VTTLFPVTAVIELTFAPIVSVGGFEVRLETIALAAVMLVTLVVAALVVRGTPVDPRWPADTLDDDGEPNHLRADDLLYIAVGALPGAAAGGRLGYVLLHLDYYAANQGAILDIGQGGFQLSLAVVGGTITAAVVATMLGGSIGRWMHALIVPLLLALAGGKAAMILGGDGQGVAWDGGWATAYAGAGPWGSLGAQIPSHPAQAYEAVATILIMLLLLMVLAAGGFQRRGPGAFLLGIAMWAGARAAVASTWRDPVVVGELRMDQLLSLAIVAGALVLLAVTLIVTWLGSRRPSATPAEERTPVRAPSAGPEWPDPASRPRI